VHVLGVIHGARARSGLFGEVAAARGHELEEWSLAWGTPPPRPLDEYGAVFVFGGSMHADQDDTHPWLREETMFLQRLLDTQTPVFGVCLGAQLLAHSLGGEVRRLARRHLDWLELRALPAAEGDPVLGALPPGAAGIHWNEDGFAHPGGAVELLASPAGSGEGFRAGERSWGVQFHPELDEAALEHWYEEWGDALGEAGVAEADARDADREHMPGQRALSEAIFGGFGRVVAGARG